MKDQSSRSDLNTLVAAVGYILIVGGAGEFGSAIDDMNHLKNELRAQLVAAEVLPPLPPAEPDLPDFTPPTHPDAAPAMPEFVTGTLEISILTVYVVGRTEDPTKQWTIEGVYLSPQAAIAACLDETYFVGPVLTNHALPADRMVWPGQFRPHQKPATSERHHYTAHTHPETPPTTAAA